MVYWNFHRGRKFADPRWCGEYWPDDHDTGAPWGICWVSHYPDEPGIWTILWYVLVADPYRRLGIATALIAAARERWPSIQITEGVTEAGEAVYESLPDDYKSAWNSSGELLT
jgi:GNAT superfamily N-acetyltransferase